MRDDESNAMDPMPNRFRCRRYKMAKDCSFDVVSEVDMQEVDNVVNQAKKKRLVPVMISVVPKRKSVLKATLSKSSVMMNIN